MTGFLLDVNVLIAMFDPAHLHHESAHRWFGSSGRQRFATCPLTENGFVRVLCNPAYPNVRGSIASVVARLMAFCSHHPTHAFWEDALSLRDASTFRAEAVRGYKQLTDVYLLGLCQKRGGRLATFDQRLTSSAIREPRPDLIELIPLH